MTHSDIPAVVNGNKECDPGGLNGMIENSPVREN